VGTEDSRRRSQVDLECFVDELEEKAADLGFVGALALGLLERDGDDQRLAPLDLGELALTRRNGSSSRRRCRP
jgi:hypothetical protein